MSKAITAASLKDQLGTMYPRPFLYCRKCGAEYSAHAGDYWNLPGNHVFRCCRVNMMLVTASRVLAEVN